jgi:hypothetical protein
MIPAKVALDETVAFGLDYILSKQAQNGSWTEWALPPGSSSAWTTAYVGFQLRHLPPELAGAAVPRIAAAASWLSAHEFAGGGWGFNEMVGADADSTAYAILFLASVGQPVSATAHSLLAKLQGADGGFATYPALGEPNSWNESHPDVTPLALLAMLTQPAPDRSALQRGIKFVVRHQTPQGMWNSFWWKSDLYATAASLALMDAAGIGMPPATALRQIEPANAFEAALLISSLLYLNQDGWDGKLRDLTDQLIRQQLPDGSWSSAPILRITRRDCDQPWATGDAGLLYTEPNRLFTTSTALYALGKALELLGD